MDLYIFCAIYKRKKRIFGKLLLSESEFNKVHQKKSPWYLHITGITQLNNQTRGKYNRYLYKL